MTSRTKSAFLFLISLPFSFQQSCEFFSGLKVHDYALLRYSFDSSNTGDSYSCTERCLSHDQCKSYNYALSGAQQGLCELNSAGRDASKPLLYRPGFVFVQAALKQETPCQTRNLQETKNNIQESPSKATVLETPSKTIIQETPSKLILHQSCFDHLKNGTRVSGKYRIYKSDKIFFDVYCDFKSESGWVWTLGMSQSHKNRAMPEFRSTSLYTNAPVNEDNPNWEAYRLSLERMKHLKSNSTHWRATCSFPAHGVDCTDYVRAKITDLDPLTYAGFNLCKKVDYLNVRGHSCTGCTSAWWQRPFSWILHHDSSFNSCEFGSTPEFALSEDNFGFYFITNPKFRCSSSDNANTNHWFGRRV